MKCNTARNKVEKIIKRGGLETQTRKEEEAITHIASCENVSCQNSYKGWLAYLKPRLELRITSLRERLANERAAQESLLANLNAEIRGLEVRLGVAIMLHAKYWPNSPLPNIIFLKEEEEAENGKEN